MKINFWKLGLSLACGIYFFSHSATPEKWNLLDWANLLIHEAGHWIFSVFGQTFYVAGGSLLQILFPTIFTIYFFRRNEIFSASLVLFWVGQNILSVAVYAGDAVKMQLELLGGRENVIHDWNFLLLHFGLLHYTNHIAFLFRTIGVAVFALAVFLGVKNSYVQNLNAKS